MKNLNTSYKKFKNIRKLESVGITRHVILTDRCFTTYISATNALKRFRIFKFDCDEFQTKKRYMAHIIENFNSITKNAKINNA